MVRSPRLVPVTHENVEAACELRVRAEQEGFVRPVAVSLAEAYVRPERAWPRVIVDEGRAVGFVMAFLDVRFRPDEPGDRPRSGLWRLNIAAGEQGKGYGTFAVRAVGGMLRERGAETMTVTWGVGEGGPEPFYLKLGFRPTGELSGDQIVAERPLGGDQSGAQGPLRADG
ncbi:GNAT family N-acetyltransferase [Streptomyces sp. BBFR2]|uniref:GNAT family N-acetyltransferase n=1 Tax=Streptomyces sp. BBFR2 TaxID=3372854 RepID=UPI0037D9CB37